MIGAGAAARSIVSALDRAGAGSIVIVNRTRSKADDVARLAPITGRVAADDPTDELAKADLIVNATSVGFGTAPDDPARCRSIRRCSTASTSWPTSSTTRSTPALLARRPRAGARTFDGLGMLVHQAALQQHLWLGQMPDVARDARRRRGRARPPRHPLNVFPKHPGAELQPSGGKNPIRVGDRGRR